MVDLQKTIPSYITDKGNIVRLIFFTAAFALVFINIYSPFGVETWYNVTPLQLFFYSSLVILTGVLVVVASRVLMYQISKARTLLLWQYLLWILAEIIFMALFYTLYESVILHEKRGILELAKVSIQNTALIILLPYSVLWLYFSWKENKDKLEALIQGDAPYDATKMVAFHDEKGILRLSLKAENLIYIEAADNYVNIHYYNKGKVSKFMLRNSLKRLEEMFASSEMVRCHRSYMVNFGKVKIIRKDKDGLRLELDVPNAQDLPVSKSYVESVMATFGKYCR
ncbi:LytTR family DNA-binding domain-containing protein [uncultured Acetobacteroides sp.]|uniref:LytR/AlgR family response regulator transcription factor n=1 Tax=uncultured Acetobacteroides sp. TaxID=1760811 RepID=UPI0029F500F6|nr:LytTR family DNA-binding domain-containing protein [uncultured Acetobacteroides sp.]